VNISSSPETGCRPSKSWRTNIELANRYFVTRHALRSALARLAKRGLIHSNQGRGSFVRRPSLPLLIERRTRFNRYVGKANATGKMQIIRLVSERAPPHVARAFDLRLTTPFVILERMATVNGQNTSISQHYFPEQRVPGFLKEYVRRQSITETLAAIGIGDYVRAETRIHARLPTPEEAELLDVPRHVPLIITEAINHDMNGVMLEYGEARFASDRVELVIQPEKNLP